MNEMERTQAPAPPAREIFETEIYETTITASYKKNYVVYLPIVRSGKLQAGTVRARVSGVDGFVVEGTLHGTGPLSGMAKLYERLKWNDGDTVHYRVISPNEIEVVPQQALAAEPVEPAITRVEPAARAARKHIHFEAFRPENLYNWSPQAEVDVYMAFGVLEENTELKYCCGVNAAILQKLGVQIEPKPDAILIDRVTEEYLIAEFEVYSRSFARTHKATDVDVLICWEDDEPDRTKLPKRVLSLSEKAREAALAMLEAEQQR